MNRIGQIIGLWVLLAVFVLGVGAVATLIKFLFSLGAVPCILAALVFIMGGSYAAVRIIANK